MTETIKKVYTIEEFLALPDGGKRFELIKGELLEMVPAGFEHGEIGVNLIQHLAPFVRQHKLGRVVSVEAAFVINQAERTVRVPDVAFVSAGRIKGRVTGALPFAPDLVTEIVSPTDSWTDINDKVEEYQTAGVRLIWVIDPRRQRVHVYRQSGPATVILGLHDELSGEDVIPGFSLKVAELFEIGN